MLALARSAGSAAMTVTARPDVQQTAWPATVSSATERRPALLGGAGLAHLAVGQGDNAIDLELRGLGNFGLPRSRRQSLRLAIGGRVVLGDLDDLPPRDDGWDLASASHTTVQVDGLNHRETTTNLREMAPGGDFLFFAADPDFQVAVLDDPRAYPVSATRFRQVVMASSGPKARYAVAVFEVWGGVQHDQMFHAMPGSPAGWRLAVPTEPGPASLLPVNVPYVATARAAENRWFVQGYGEFADLARGASTGATSATLAGLDGGGVRLHLLGDTPIGLMTARTPRGDDDEARHSTLLLRRRSLDDAALRTTFVTLFEPIRPGVGAMKVGRVAAEPGVVVLYLETADGPEHLVFNDRPGTSRTVELADGRKLASDGLVTRVRADTLAMAGGTEAATSGIALRQPRYAGKILAAARFASAESRGWFETEAPLPAGLDPSGRILLIRHGDGSTRGWTLLRVEPTPGGRSRLVVREEPGFLIEGADQAARYYQFPGGRIAGPHSFRIATINRGQMSSDSRLSRGFSP